MLRSLKTAEQAMQREALRVEALANNLANVDTAGFKQILTTVQESEFGRSVAPAAATAASLRASPASWSATRAPWPPQTPLRTLQATDVRPGVLRATGRATDVAVAGSGFFVVETPAGEMFTRDGSFRTDEQDRLVTVAGHPVLGEGGPVRVAGGELVIAEDGTVRVDGETAGRLRLVDFAEPQRLEHRGGNLLAAPADMPPVPVARERVRLQQGQLESSNVDPIQTLVDMIAAQRAFEVASQVMTANDELLDKSVNQLSKSR